MNSAALKALVRSIPDYPKPGNMCRDITTLIRHGEGFAATVEWLARRAEEASAQAIVGIEARGFIFGAAVAAKLTLPFVPVRKPGKMPVPTLAIDYALEYGTDRLELDPEAISHGQLVMLIDDLLATGGTAAAAAQLVRKAGGIVDHALFVIDLPDLGGAASLQDIGIEAAALIAFDGH